ncbi:uncharacterized protein LOC117343851 [Pecten maximus]|uniref:uncharacterized protein LOC117343851 n=1 Tax=Pecten maximus TaxID=6579 RepID=UPI001458FFEE|nr:uncharacterized protein LOC117343851 [Pecten maximus]
MTTSTEDFITARVKAAVEASQEEIVSKMSSVISHKLDSFEHRMSDCSEAHFSKLQQNILCGEPHKFSRKSCEDQHKFNVKVRAKLMEAEHLSTTEPLASKAKILEGIGLIDYRQKLVKLADTSDCGWKAVDEYIANPIASDSDDERKMDRARARANRKAKDSKLKANKGRGRYTPYSDQRLRSNNATGNTQDGFRGGPQRSAISRPGSCFACGKFGHWRVDCPALAGGTVTSGSIKA